jgi:hypothetical protein
VETRDCFLKDCLREDLKERICSGFWLKVAGLSSPFSLRVIMRFSFCSCFSFISLESPSRWEVFLEVDSANFSFQSLITVLAYCNSCSYFFRFLSTISSHLAMAPSALLLRSSREWLLLASALFCLSWRNSLARSAESLCFWSAS